MDWDFVNLTIAIIQRDDGMFVAECSDLGISVNAETVDLAVSRLWNLMSLYLSSGDINKFTVEIEGGLPYFGPGGGTH
jgi:hypothetical protein